MKGEGVCVYLQYYKIVCDFYILELSKSFSLFSELVYHQFTPSSELY